MEISADRRRGMSLAPKDFPVPFPASHLTISTLGRPFLRSPFLRFLLSHANRIALPPFPPLTKGLFLRTCLRPSRSSRNFTPLSLFALELLRESRICSFQRWCRFCFCCRDDLCAVSVCLAYLCFAIPVFVSVGFLETLHLAKLRMSGFSS